MFEVEGDKPFFSFESGRRLGVKSVYTRLVAPAKLSVYSMSDGALLAVSCQGLASLLSLYKAISQLLPLFDNLAELWKLDHFR